MRNWHGHVLDALHKAKMAWRQEVNRFDRLLEAKSPPPQEVEDAAQEMARHVEQVLAAVRDLPKAVRMDAERCKGRARRERNG